MRLCHGCGCPVTNDQVYCELCAPLVHQWTVCQQSECAMVCPKPYCSVCYMRAKLVTTGVQCRTCDFILPHVPNRALFAGADTAQCFKCQRKSQHVCELCNTTASTGRYCDPCLQEIQLGATCNRCGDRCNYFKSECASCFVEKTQCATNGCRHPITHATGRLCRSCHWKTLRVCAIDGCQNRSKFPLCHTCHVNQPPRPPRPCRETNCLNTTTRGLLCSECNEVSQRYVVHRL